MPRRRRSSSCVPQCQACAACQIIAAPVAVLSASIFVGQNISGWCTGFLLWPMVAIALFLLTTAILLFLRRARDAAPFACVGAIVLFLLGLLILLVFGYVAIGGIDIVPPEVREYDLKDYSGWLRGRTADQRYWDKLSACLRHNDACDRMATRPLVRDPRTGILVPETSSEERKEAKQDPDHPPPVLTPIESGCCKPPLSCGFTHVNGTTWTPTPGAPAVETSVDCSRWSNDQQKLCFQCDSCKAGLLADMKKIWGPVGIILITLLVYVTGSIIVLAVLANRS